MEKEQITIGEAAKFLEVSIDTLRRWDASGKLKAHRSAGGHRYYFISDLRRFRSDLYAIGESWVSSEQPPVLPDEYYCERSDQFSARLNRMGVDLLASNAIPQELVSLVVAVAGEIGDNSFAHNIGNWPDVPGVYFAYDIDKHLIVLADRGQGILKTLGRVKPDLDNDKDALKVAFTEFISGRSPERRGNGLKLVRRVVESNPLSLRFQTGLAVARISMGTGSMRISDALRNIRGTFARIDF